MSRPILHMPLGTWWASGNLTAGMPMTLTLTLTLNCQDCDPKGREWGRQRSIYD